MDRKLEAAADFTFWYEEDVIAFKAAGDVNTKCQLVIVFSQMIQDTRHEHTQT